MAIINGESSSTLVNGIRSISPLYASLIFVSLCGWFIYSTLKWQRYGRYRDIPELPKSLLWGHLDRMGIEMQKSKVDGSLAHVDYSFCRMYDSLPEHKGVMALNLWPAEYNMLFVTSHKVAEQLSRSSKEFRYSVYKSPTMHIFDALIGKDSILAKEDEDWKESRRLFNPGFAPNHLITLLPQILSKTKIFLARLDELAESGKEFEASTIFTSLTFDIIGAVTLGVDLNAQEDEVSKQHPIVREFMNVLQYFDNMYRVNLNQFVILKRYLAGRRLEKAVETVVWEKWNELQEERQAPDQSSKKVKDKSVLGLALQDLNTLDATTARTVASQLRTFLFAGHDTTASLLQWAAYKLSTNEEGRTGLNNELDSVFGKGDILEALSKPDGGAYLSQLPYTSAIIKETLRLYPPAGTARRTPRGTGLRLRLDDDSEILADEFVLYVSHYAIHRDPVAYGADAEVWRPDRWVGNAETSADKTNGGENTDSKNDIANSQKAADQEIPASAWRPFERGPRNCIGQELANLEARVILACMARNYVFKKVGHGSKEGEEPLNKWQITSKPLDGMRMTVSFADS